MKKQLIAVASGIAVIVTACAHHPVNTSAARAPVAAPQGTVNELGQPLPKAEGVPPNKICAVRVDVFPGGTFRVDGKNCAADTLGGRIAEIKKSSTKPLFVVDVREHAGASSKDVSAVMDASVAAGVANLSLSSGD